MLLQLHHEFKDHTEMVSQDNINNETEMRAWKKDVQSRHPLPKNAKWMVCNEGSEHFVMTLAG